jgi:hypothetical protein
MFFFHHTQIYNCLVTAVCQEVALLHRNSLNLGQMQDPRFYKEFTPAPHLARFIEAYWTLHRDSAFKPVRRYIYADGLAEMFVNLGTCIPLVDGKIPLKPGRLYYGGTMTATSYIDGLPDSHSASAPKPLSTSSVSTTW